MKDKIMEDRREEWARILSKWESVLVLGGSVGGGLTHVHSVGRLTVSYKLIC